MSRWNLWSDAEVEKIRDVLESIEYPPGIVSWKFELGEDWTGEPAVRIWLFVDEEVVQRKETVRVTMGVERKILDAFRAAGIQRWPYLRVRTEAEQRELDSAKR
jgi:hypothetical protein